VKPNIITLDVRADLRAGREPFSKIMEAVAALQAEQSLRILAPFEPLPLMELLGRQGFQHAASANAAGDWEVFFTRGSGGSPVAVQPAVPPPPGGGIVAGRPLETIELDARGLEPPQPLVTILEALGSLPAHAELRAHTDRRPMHLYAQLEERGFTGDSQEQPDGSFITHIRHR
jgi:uncharacterized protein (DUF2249 family)